MKEDFLIQSEGDCERVAAVLVKWLKDNNQEMLEKNHSIAAPCARWALMFEAIFSDEIENHDLHDVAAENVIELTFVVDTINHSIRDSLSNMSDDELLDALGDYLAEREDDIEDDEDNDEDEEENNNE